MVVLLDLVVLDGFGDVDGVVLDHVDDGGVLLLVLVGYLLDPSGKGG